MVFGLLPDQETFSLAPVVLSREKEMERRLSRESKFGKLPLTPSPFRVAVGLEDGDVSGAAIRHRVLVLHRRHMATLGGDRRHLRTLSKCSEGLQKEAEKRGWRHHRVVRKDKRVRFITGVAGGVGRPKQNEHFACVAASNVFSNFREGRMRELENGCSTREVRRMASSIPA